MLINVMIIFEIQMIDYFENVMASPRLKFFD